MIWETYGGMEGPATIAKPHRWLERPGTVGRAIRGTRLAILDDDGNELPAGELGAIYYGSDAPSFEYVGDAETTRAAYRGSSSPSATSASSTTTVISSSATGRRT